MRTAACLLILSLVATAAPAAAIVVLSDAAGDIDIEAAGATAGRPLPPTQATQDLATLTVDEGDETIAFEVTFHPPASGGGLVNQAPARLGVHFSHASQPYLVDLVPPGVEDAVRLYRTDAAGAQHAVLDAARQGDLLLGPVSFGLPRSALIDETGAPPLPGAPLHRFAVDVAHLLVPVGGAIEVTATDRAPDEGFDGTLVMQLGAASSGDLRLHSRSPVRVSNGEAGTFVYPVSVTNDGAEGTFELRVLDAADPFTVDLPTSLIQLAGGGTATVPVLIEVPFQHRHGAYERAGLEVRGIGDPDRYARLEIGVLYHSVPQPAGHHPRLWIQADRSDADLSETLLGDAEAVAFMNAGGPPDDGAAAVAGHNDTLVRDRFHWRIDLRPNLQMGLDFDRARPVAMEVAFSTQGPADGATASGRLVHAAPDDDGRIFETVVATFAPEALSLSPGQVVSWSPTAPVSVAADLLPYHREGRLTLELTVALSMPVTRLDRDAPRLQLPGTLDLPLHEYRDPLPAEVARDGDIVARVTAPQRIANPGAWVLFAVEAEGPPGIRMEPHLRGHHAEWGVLPQGAAMRTDGDGRAAFAVVVQVPEDAPSGDSADIILSLEAPGQAPGLARLLVVVDDTQDHADDRRAAAELWPTHGSPSTWVWAVFAVLAARLSRR